MSGWERLLWASVWVCVKSRLAGASSEEYRADVEQAKSKDKSSDATAPFLVGKDGLLLPRDDVVLGQGREEGRLGLLEVGVLEETVGVA